MGAGEEVGGVEGVGVVLEGMIVGGTETGTGVGIKGAGAAVEGKEVLGVLAAFFSAFLALSTYRGPIFHLFLFNSTNLSQYLVCQTNCYKQATQKDQS